MIVMRAAVTPLGLATLMPPSAVQSAVPSAVRRGSHAAADAARGHAAPSAGAAPSHRRPAAAPSRMRVPTLPVDDARTLRDGHASWLGELMQRCRRAAGTDALQVARLTNWGWPRRGEPRDNPRCSQQPAPPHRPHRATRMSNSYLLFADTVIEDDGTLDAEASAAASPDSEWPDEWVRGWHDSSYDLRRGLMVIELDIDPAVTHGSLAAPKP
jgi:hypothetical protein